MEAATCAECGRRFGGDIARTTSLAGRTICTACDGALVAAAAGAAMNPASPVAAALSTHGWFQRLRRWRKGRR